MSLQESGEICTDYPPGPSQLASTEPVVMHPGPADESSSKDSAFPTSIKPVSDPANAIVPPQITSTSIIIEFCDRCRWAPRATWIQTELFLTFPTPLIRSITLQPLNSPETGGRFRVWLDRGNGHELVWDRKTEGGFPELKVLKQRIRNLVQPDMGLGHSDAHGTSTKHEVGATGIPENTKA